MNTSVDDLDVLPVTARLHHSFLRGEKVRKELWGVQWSDLSRMWNAMGFSMSDAAPLLNMLSCANWGVGDIVSTLSVMSELRTQLLADRKVIDEHERSKKTFFGPAMLKHLGELVSALDEMLALYDASEVM